jgi:hypothetical protein
MSLQSLDVGRTASAWSSLAGTISVPHSLDEYRRLAALLILSMQLARRSASARFSNGNSGRAGGGLRIGARRGVDNE